MENGAIMTAASRWSLLIDPQLQGIQWIIRREQPNGLVIMQQSQPRYIEQVVTTRPSPDLTCVGYAYTGLAEAACAGGELH